VRSGCARLQVAPATHNCGSSRSAGSQSMAAEPARLSARTIDGELARRLSTLHSDTGLHYQTRGLNCLSDQVSPFTRKEMGWILIDRNTPRIPQILFAPPSAQESNSAQASFRRGFGIVRRVANDDRFLWTHK
jgi:hypothetical protein